MFVQFIMLILNAINNGIQRQCQLYTEIFMMLPFNYFEDNTFIEDKHRSVSTVEQLQFLEVE